MASIQIRFNNNEDSRQVTTRKLPDLPAKLTGTAYWKAHRKSKRNSYILKLHEEDSDGGQPVSYELLVEYINYCWYSLNWNKALKQYFTNPKELLPEGYGGLQRGEPPADEPGPSTIPPPIQPLGEPLQAGMTFSEGIHSLLQGTMLNIAQESSPITAQPPQITVPILPTCYDRASWTLFFLHLFLPLLLPYLLYYGHSPFAPHYALRTVFLPSPIYYTPYPHPHGTIYACISTC